MRCILIREVQLPFETVLKKLPHELKRHGFQLLASIRVDKELHESLGIDYKKCAILNISNLQLAYKALLHDEQSALLQFLPLYIYQKDEGTILSTTRPTQLFPILQNFGREDDALVLEKKLNEVLDALCRKSLTKAKKGEQKQHLQAVA